MRVSRVLDEKERIRGSSRDRTSGGKTASNWFLIGCARVEATRQTSMIDATPVLGQQAERIRQLARGIDNKQGERALIELAEEYEAKAAATEASNPESKP